MTTGVGSASAVLFNGQEISRQVAHDSPTIMAEALLGARAREARIRFDGVRLRQIHP